MVPFLNTVDHELSNKFVQSIFKLFSDVFWSQRLVKILVPLTLGNTRAHFFFLPNMRYNDIAVGVCLSCHFTCLISIGCIFSRVLIGSSCHLRSLRLARGLLISYPDLPWSSNGKKTIVARSALWE